MHGFLPIDKPAGVTSRAVVNRVDKWFPGVRVGHAGTLDPLATGVLVLALGVGTRLIEYVQKMGKTYRSLFRLGATSDTDDADGHLQPVAGAQPPSRAEIESVLQGMIGDIQQVPPRRSAIWVEGKRAYHLARKGNPVELEARPVRVEQIHLLQYAYPHLEVEIACGKGTYIRSIARDLGQHLGCGAYVAELCRTRVGQFTLEQAVSSESTPAEARFHIRPLAAATVEMPRVVLSLGELQRLHHGLTVDLPPAMVPTTPGNEVAVWDAQGRLHVIALWKDGRLKPSKGFISAVEDTLSAPGK
jgi:tRNA pseudouridine55 synthase